MDAKLKAVAVKPAPKPVLEPELWVIGHDMHYPLIHWPTWYCFMDFVSQNKPHGLILGGDQFDNVEISHHTKSKPIFRERAAYRKNTQGFDDKVLKPLDNLGVSKKIWIQGNHERFEQDLIDEQPELEGMVEHTKLLHLADRNWEVVDLGHAYKLGKLTVIHGEILTGIGNQAGMYPSRKAVELYASCVLAGHTHAPQSFSRPSPVDATSKWMGWIAPCMCSTNPSYIRNRPTAWLNGFTIVEKLGQQFNLYTIIPMNGKFVFGGKIYGR